MQELLFTRLNPDAILPSANGADAMAVDLCACRDYLLLPGKLPVLVDTGVVFSAETRCLLSGAQLSLRSGFASKTGCYMNNGVGLIERSFVGFELEGEAHGICCAISTTHRHVIKAGDRIAQLLLYGAFGQVLSPAALVIEWCSNDYSSYQTWYDMLGPGVNGRSGFGSTGNR